MKRKHLLPLLILALVLSMCIFVACTNEEEHTCSFGEWQTRTEAGCVQDGLEYRKCACGNEETQIIPATGHTQSDWIVDKEATCKEAGSKHKECSVCHANLATESIAKSDNHAYGDGTLNISSDGKTATTDAQCTLCGNEDNKPYTGNLLKENIVYSFEN